MGEDGCRRKELRLREGEGGGSYRVVGGRKWRGEGCGGVSRVTSMWYAFFFQVFSCGLPLSAHCSKTHG